jgi:hypothetical protein
MLDSPVLFIASGVVLAAAGYRALLWLVLYDPLEGCPWRNLR